MLIKSWLAPHCVISRSWHSQKSLFCAVYLCFKASQWEGKNLRVCICAPVLLWWTCLPWVPLKTPPWCIYVLNKVIPAHLPSLGSDLILQDQRNKNKQQKQSQEGALSSGWIILGRWGCRSVDKSSLKAEKSVDVRRAQWLVPRVLAETFCTSYKWGPSH